MNPAPSRITRIILRIEKWIDRFWAVPVLAVLAGIDLFVMFIPTEAILISSVMLRPRRWFWICLCITTGSALGALALAASVKYFGPSLIQLVMGHVLESEKWQKMEQLISKHGDWALAGIALSPLPQQPAVAIAALGKMPSLLVALLVWLGRFPKYLLFSWLASHSPRVLLRFKWVRRELSTLWPDRN